jgi:hypothetical protein
VCPTAIEHEEVTKPKDYLHTITQDYYTKALLAYKNTKPKDCKTKGLQNQRIAKPKDFKNQRITYKTKVL